MPRPLKGAAAFFSFFGLMFLVPGLLSLLTFLRNSRNHSTSGTIAGAAIALSFKNDPSNNVRERAGCNLSDCGNFTRLQRLRMVPKFLDLVADPSTNAQMKSWSYMALREITDANVPVDPRAWRNWYHDHGSEKAAEFERFDWWQVRGDE